MPVENRLTPANASRLLSGVALALAFALGQVPAAAQPQGLPDFSELVERVGPAVVNIRTSEKVKVPEGQAQMNDQMREFFRRFGIQVPNPGRGAPDEEAPTRIGVGSGFILSGDGYVMTNAHVVQGADEVIVTLTDKRELKAKLIGADARTDVAVVKVDATELPFVRIGDSDKAKVGEWVLAIGSPFGLENTVTAGIVSAKQRETGELLPLLQTDVAVNQGNSGGPLVNMRGEVIGINSAVVNPFARADQKGAGFIGISLAIPIVEAMRVADELRAGGRVVRGYLGVLPEDVSKETAEAIGLGKAQGAVISSVVEGSPADKAGIEGADVVLKVDGKVVEKAADLRRLVAAVKPGSKTTLTVFRRGERKDIVVTIGEDERSKKAGAVSEPANDAAPAALPSAAWGLKVSELSEAQRKELKLKSGVKVDGATGAAARAGLREGDLILSVDNVEVPTVKVFQAQIAKAEKGKSISLVVRREGITGFVLLKPAP